MLHSIYYSVSRVVNIAVLVSLPIVSAILVLEIGILEMILVKISPILFLLLLGNIGK